MGLARSGWRQWFERSSHLELVINDHSHPPLWIFFYYTNSPSSCPSYLAWPVAGTYEGVDGRTQDKAEGLSGFLAAALSHIYGVSATLVLKELTGLRKRLRREEEQGRQRSWTRLWEKLLVGGYWKGKLEMKVWVWAQGLACSKLSLLKPRRAPWGLSHLQISVKHTKLRLSFGSGANIWVEMMTLLWWAPHSTVVELMSTICCLCNLPSAYISIINHSARNLTQISSGPQIRNWSSP